MIIFCRSLWFARCSSHATHQSVS